MSLPVRLKGVDGGGAYHELSVTSTGSVRVEQQDPISLELPVETLTRRKLFYELFKSSSDSESMTVDGSTNPVEFYLAAQANRVRWVQKIRFIIEGNNFDLSASGDFKRFGSAASSPGLTNGVEFFVEQGGLTTNIFESPVKTMGDFFYYHSGYDNFINAVTSQADYLSVDIVLPWDVALPASVGDRLVIRINDDLVDANFLKFNALASGYQEVE